jgi:hypothetical protein
MPAPLGAVIYDAGSLEKGLLTGSAMRFKVGLRRMYSVLFRAFPSALHFSQIAVRPRKTVYVRYAIQVIWTNIRPTHQRIRSFASR